MAGAPDCVVIGGGFFGARLAIHLGRSGRSVVLLEKAARLLTRASYVNQARVHNGYHYPRSLLTALRSRVNYERFVSEYPGCVVGGFDQYYAVARALSNVTAAQFVRFLDRIGAPHEAAPDAIARLFDLERVEAVFKVRECAFDAAKLREQLLEDLRKAKVEVRCPVEVRKVRLGPVVVLSDGSEVKAGRVFNCSYALLNQMLFRSGLSLVPLKHEVTELVLIEPPPELRGVGVTVMCGPFFSTMPFPPRGLHTLSHVRYTPHQYWHDVPGETPRDGHVHLASQALGSHFIQMQKDAQRYLPALARARRVDSLWEVKTVLPASEVDDSRPILFHRHPQLPSLVSVLGGKIDNVYDALKEVDATP